MANQEHLERLKNSSVEQWNTWKEDNPDIEINLSNADLRHLNFSGINFSKVVLANANLQKKNKLSVHVKLLKKHSESLI